MRPAAATLQRWFAAASNQLTSGGLARQFALELIARIATPICVVRQPGLQIELANRAMCELLGDPEPIGRKLCDVCPGSAIATLRNELGCLEGSSMTTLTNISIASSASEADGDAAYYDWSLCPLRSGTGLVAAFAHDVTAHVRARIELEHARLQAEDANRKKGEFVAQIAHELRTPLASISAAVAVLREPNSADPQRARLALERQTRHLSRLIADLMEAARSEHQHLALRPERVQLGDIIEQAVELATPLLRAHQHGLSVDVARNLLVDADPGRLMQVVCNLVTNAAKYTADGGSIRIAARRVENEVVVTISDTGIGIAAEMLPRIFDRFVQVPGSETRSEGGLGLGLHIVRTLMREHGGRVEVQSEGVGRGSKFSIHLPSSGSAQLQSQSGEV